MPILSYAATFFFITLASYQVGRWFAHVGLPKITGYLLTGIVAGPFMLALLPTEATTALRFVDELSLGIIAFVAGSEVYLKELRPRLRTIRTVTGAIIVTAFTLTGGALFFLTEVIPFTQGMDVASRAAVAILGATVLLALSPPSTIAVIKEARARGPFSRTVLGITVSMDVVIIILFAVSVAIASALLTEVGFSATFAALLLVDLGAAVVAGYGVGLLLQALLDLSLPRPAKLVALLATGFAIFYGAYHLLDVSRAALPFEIHVEPLLVAMIGGFMVTNLSAQRDQFADLLHDAGPPVYVAFFTLTGIAIKLDILLSVWYVALALFAVRLGGIALGAWVGGRLAGEPASFNRWAWAGLVTQAGIALGLAREVGVEFPSLGDAFATLVISVVVLNEIVGPLFLKWVLRRVGESAQPEAAEADSVRDALILGIEEQSLELARQLQASGWRVVMADTDRSHVERLADEEVAEHWIPRVDAPALAGLLTPHTDALVALLDDDEANLAACELARARGVARLIVRPQSLMQAESFRELGALVVDPTSAMVHLLDQSVRAPTASAVLLHQDSGREMIQVTISNPDVEGQLVRDLRLPTDVLFLDVTRGGHSLVPNGYTRLHLRDEVTLIGHRRSLEEVTLRLGY